MNINVCLVIVAVTAWSLSVCAHAQSIVNPDKVSSRQSLLDRFDPWEDPSGSSHAPQSPGDSDLGEQLLLMPQSVYEPLSLRLSQRGTWTSNAALTEDDELDDFFSHTEVGAAFVPSLFGNTFAEIGADYGIYRYAEHSLLDFDSLEARAGIIQALPGLGSSSVWLRYNHLRLLSGRGHDEIFTDHSIEAGLYFPIPLAARQSAFLSYASEFSIDGNPGYARRHEHRLMTGYKIEPTDRMEVAAYYEFAVLDYIEAGRMDLLHTAGLSWTTHLTQGIDLILAGSYSINDSDMVGADYEVGDIGTSLSIKVQF